MHLEKKQQYSFHLLFLFFFVFLCFFYDYLEVLTALPDGIHVWRQSDGLSIAYKFYENGNSLFEPQMHNQLTHEGKAAGEFPLMYYIVSLLYSLFGVKVWIYRSLWILITAIGYFYLYRFVSSFLKDHVWGIMIALFTFTSPILIIYGASFIPDPIALSFTFISWFHIYKYYKERKRPNLIWATVFATLAVTLKITSLLSLLALGLVLAFSVFRKDIRDGLTTKKVLSVVIPFGVLFLITAAWYMYAAWFNKINETSYFFMQSAPIWEIPADQLERAHERLNGWAREYFYPTGRHTLYILAGLTVLPLFNKFLKKENYWLNLFCILGFLSFGFLFYSQFEFHDYYVIGLVFIVPVVSMFFIKKFQGYINQVKWVQYLFYAAFALLLFASSKHAIKRSTERFRFHDSILTDELYELKNNLEVFGIAKNDKIIVPNDPSPNIILYTLNREGWTGLNTLRSREDILARVEQGGKWMLITDSVYNSEVIESFKHKIVHNYKGIRIYKMRD